MMRWLKWFLATTTEALEAALVGMAVVGEMATSALFGGDGGARAATMEINPAEQSLGRARAVPPDSCDNLPRAVQAGLVEAIVRAGWKIDL